MSYQQDLQLGPYFEKWRLAIDQGLPRFPINHFAKIIIVAQVIGWSKFPRNYCNSNLQKLNFDRKNVLFFVCLRSATTFFPRGQLPREDFETAN